jgi:hypothetical protein
MGPSGRTEPRVSTSGPGVEEARAMEKWEYLLVPLEEAGGLRKNSDDLPPERLNALGRQGWEAVGLTLKRGDLVAWPVVLLKRSAS